MSFIKQLLIFTVLILSLINCGKAPVPVGLINNSSSIDDNQPEPENPQLPMACFPGKDNRNETCFSTFEKSSMPRETAEEYDYLIPTNDNFPPQFSKEQYSPPVRFFDLSNISGDTFLTKSFQLKEFLSPIKGQFGIFSPLAIEKIQKMRDELNTPIVINSGYRSPAYNSNLQGSAKWSRHQYGDAIDFKSPKFKVEDLKKYCLDQGADFFQIYKNHIHCDWRNHQLTNAFYPSIIQPTAQKRDAYKEFREASQLLISKTFRGNTLASVTHPEKEDHDDLLYIWTIKYKDKKIKVIRNYSSQLEVHDTENIHKISVNVGGSVIVD